MFKFVELLNSTNMKLLRNLSIYIFHAFKCRTEQLYENRSLLSLGFITRMLALLFVIYESD